MLEPGPLTLDQVLDNCARIRPRGRRRCLETVLRDTGVDPIGCARASGMVERTVDLHTTGTPPAGAVVIWTGGHNGDGHIVVSAGRGDCWTVDWVDGLHQTKVSIAAINRIWNNLDYAGWATNYGGRFALDVEAGPMASPAALPSLKLSRFLDSRSEMHQPRDVKQHPLTVATAEHALRKLGFRPGPIDGHYGTATDQAVREFQASLDDPADGELGRKQWAKLASRSELFVAVA